MGLSVTKASSPYQHSETMVEFSRGIEWRTSRHLVDYPDAVSFMEERAAEIAYGQAPETVWLLEHPAIYTAGTSSKTKDLLKPDKFPVYAAGRGGQYTYHGPGQRVAYVLLDLSKRKSDIRAYVQNLEAWIITTLAEFNINGKRRAGRIGIWVENDMGVDKKIAAIGVRIRKWVTFHGIAINVSPNLSHFDGIVPCGIKGYGVTSFKDLGVPANLGHLDLTLKETFPNQFDVT